MKYILIRNEAMQKDTETFRTSDKYMKIPSSNAPNLTLDERRKIKTLRTQQFIQSFECNDNLKQAILGHSANYLIEIISLVHDSKCEPHNEFRNLLNDSKRFHLAQKNQMSKDDFTATIQTLKDQFTKQMLDDEEKIKIFTSNLGKVMTNTYWGYYTSREHSKLLSEIIHESNEQFTSLKGKGLTYNHIALIYYFEDQAISSKNATQIANDNGFSSSTSGELLTRHYRKLEQKKNRLGTGYSKRELNARIKQFEIILPHLTVSAKERASSELAQLNEIYIKSHG